MFWGCNRGSKSTVFRLFALIARAIASAQAVLSSNKDALAMPNPVNSHTIVCKKQMIILNQDGDTWKLSRLSRRPCEISG